MNTVDPSACHILNFRLNEIMFGFIHSHAARLQKYEEKLCVCLHERRFISFEYFSCFHISIHKADAAYYAFKSYLFTVSSECNRFVLNTFADESCEAEFN